MSRTIGFLLIIVVALAASSVHGHSVAWCFGIDGQQNEVLAIGSYHFSSECCWNSASTTISTSGTEPWGPSMVVTNYLLESVSGTESSYFGCGSGCTYCSSYSASSINTWQVKVFPAGTFTQGSTYGIAQSSTQATDAPLCSIPGGGATFPVLPPLGVQAINCPGDQSSSTSPTYPGCTTSVTYSTPTCTTACPGSTCYAQRTAGPASGGAFSSGTTVVTHELYVDGQPTGDTCSFNVVVPDGQAPQNTYCPPDQSFCGPSPHQFFWASPTFVDCSSITTSSTHSSGDSFGPGTTTVIYTATDAFGNPTQCAFQVTLFSGPPTISCPGDFEVDDSDATPSTPGGGVATYYTANYAVSAVDGCGNPIATSQTMGPVGPPAAIEHSALPQQFGYVTDPDPINGMTDSCTFTVSLAAGATYAQITWVGQPESQYRFGNGPSTQPGQLWMYVPVRVCWQGQFSTSDMASLVIHDGTTIRHSFISQTTGSTTFPLATSTQCETFMGPHSVNINANYYLGLMSSTATIGNNWLPFSLGTAPIYY